MFKCEITFFYNIYFYFAQFPAIKICLGHPVYGNFLLFFLIRRIYINMLQYEMLHKKKLYSNSFKNLVAFFNFWFIQTSNVKS